MWSLVPIAPSAGKPIAASLSRSRPIFAGQGAGPVSSPGNATGGTSGVRDEPFPVAATTAAATIAAIVGADRSAVSFSRLDALSKAVQASPLCPAGHIDRPDERRDERLLIRQR